MFLFAGYNKVLKQRTFENIRHSGKLNRDSKHIIKYHGMAISIFMKDFGIISAGIFTVKCVPEINRNQNLIYI